MNTKKGTPYNKYVDECAGIAKGILIVGHITYPNHDDVITSGLKMLSDRIKVDIPTLQLRALKYDIVQLRTIVNKFFKDFLKKVA